MFDTAKSLTALKKIKNGGEAKLDVLEGLNHSQACEKAFTAERLEWVFSH